MTRKYLFLLHIFLIVSLIYPPNLFSDTKPLKKYDPRASIIKNAQQQGDVDFSQLFPQLADKLKEKEGKDILRKFQYNKDVAGKEQVFNDGSPKKPAQTPSTASVNNSVPANANPDQAPAPKGPDKLEGKVNVTPKSGNAMQPIADNYDHLDLEIHLCFLFDTGAWNDDKAINDIVKLNGENYAKCGIAVTPHVFKVDYMPPDADQINKLSQQVCPMNKEFYNGGGGSAVQALTRYTGTSDHMCREKEKRRPKDEKDDYGDIPGWAESVAGCSVLGNGNAKDSGGLKQNSFDKVARGNYGGRGQKGQPATSIVDVGQGPSVSFHEFGHSNGGPGRGGDYLVNIGESVKMGHKPGKPVGCGLEMLGEPDPLASNSAAEGGGTKDNCFFEQNQALGCASLRGGANPNVKDLKWNKNYKYQGDEKIYNFMAGKSFFEEDRTAPAPRPVIAKHQKEPNMPALRDAKPAVLAESTPTNVQTSHTKGKTGDKIEPVAQTPAASGSASLRKGDFARQRPNELQEEAAKAPPPSPEQGRDRTRSTVRVDEGADGGNGRGKDTGLSTAQTENGKQISVGDTAAANVGENSQPNAGATPTAQDTLAASVGPSSESLGEALPGEKKDPSKDRVRSGDGTRQTSNRDSTVISAPVAASRRNNSKVRDDSFFDDKNGGDRQEARSNDRKRSPGTRTRGVASEK